MKTMEKIPFLQNYANVWTKEEGEIYLYTAGNFEIEGDSAVYLHVYIGEDDEMIFWAVLYGKDWNIAFDDK